MAQTETKQEYAHPEVLVDTQWIEDHLTDDKVRIAEVDYDPTSNYELGHIPGSVLIKWKADINDPVTRDILSKEAFEELLQRIGVNNDTTLALYGDFNNLFAAFAFWVFKYYGFHDVRLVNGGRKKWLLEDRPLTKDVQNYAKGNYKVTKEPDKNIRVYLDYVRNTLGVDHWLMFAAQRNLQAKSRHRQNIQQSMLKEEDIYQEQSIFHGHKQ